MALSVVYVHDTGHVVGALALTGAGAPADVASLVGRALPFRVPLDRGRTVTLGLDAKELRVATVDDEPGVFAEPLAFGVELVEDKPKPTLVRLKAWKDGLKLSTTELGVTVTDASARPTKVVALVSDEQDTLVLTAQIPANKQAVNLPVSFAEKSSHGVLVLASGWAGRLETLKAVAP
ncbi:hypothetical protein [Streptomyces sp. BPTC-684]|uniref:hypothetical protein n=1 Tax=Streptomyces sp. BPTC-684 TaxID=3043734 RepID=UPI0024B23877|nr:hypothetical protein [Streptomyces sp. BPTC-684]WHM41041.1 hypothetical protein QIY60_32025 [Streptomyces sp. BPTC-684]